MGSVDVPTELNAWIVGRLSYHEDHRKCHQWFILVQANEFFVRKPPSILLNIDIFLDHQFRAVQLTMAAQLRRFCVGLAYNHPGGTASRILQVRDRAS